MALSWVRRGGCLRGPATPGPPTLDAIFESAAASCSNALQRVGPPSPRPHSALPQPLPADDAGDPPGPRHRWRANLPSAQQVAALLRGPGSCGSAAAPAPALPAPLPEPPVSWEEVVERARAARAAGLLPDPGTAALTDTFGRRHTYLRLSLTERCNLRCLYCMPEEGVDLTPRPELLTTGEVLRLARLFVGAGVTKVRLTGGEPTLRRDLVDIVAGVADIEGVEAVGLTSNGLTLGRSLPALRDAGLSLLNVSLDTLRPERFEAMTRRRGHERVLDTIWRAVDLGFDPVKVNVVVMRGVNDDEVPAFVALTKDAPINVRFIEYMPFDGNVWAAGKMVPLAEMAAAAGGAALRRRPDPAGEVARNYSLTGHAGTVSFVASMTHAFCGDCNRLRVMADGALKACLFGAAEVSLRDAMRGGADDDDLLAVVSAAVNRKKAAHAGMFELARSKNRAMVKIGG